MYGMRKTTIYLPDELKARLETVVEQERLPQAEVIRRAIEQFVDGAHFRGRRFRSSRRSAKPIWRRGTTSS